MMGISIDNDESVLNEGIWRDFSGSSFLIAHSSNLVFQRALAKFQQPLRNQINKGNADPGELVDVMCKALSQGILKNWKGVTSNGSEVAYTADLGFKALKNNVALREFIQEVSTSIDSFRSEEVEAMGKS